MKHSQKILFAFLIGATLAIIGCGGGLINLIGTKPPNPKCGLEEYNPYKKICYEDTLYDYCCSEAYHCLRYDPATEGCSKDGLVLQKCGLDLYNPTIHSCKSGTLTANSTFIDSRDNITYKYAAIGDQVWMAENLRYGWKGYGFKSKYGDDPDEVVIGDYGGYIYGNQYTFNEAKDACPKGWHLPTINEWQKLVNFAGGNAVAGKRLKAEKKWEKEYTESKKGIIGSTRIITGKYTISGNGTDDYGFSAMPGGIGFSSSRGWMGEKGEWWSTSEGSGSLVPVYKGYVMPNRQPLSLRMKSDSDGVEIDGIQMRDGVSHVADYKYQVSDLRLSIRCIADESEAQRLKALEQKQLQQQEQQTEQELEQ